MTGDTPTTQELLDEIHRLNAELDKLPSYQDMNAEGEYSIWAYVRQFESWNAAIEAAGYDPRPARDAYTRSELIAEIKRVAEQCGRKPTTNDMTEYGAVSQSTYLNTFESWNAALEAAGFEPRTNGQQIGHATLCLELQRLADSVGGRPTTTEMQQQGPYSPGTYIANFGSWEAALKTAGLATE